MESIAIMSTYTEDLLKPLRQLNPIAGLLIDVAQVVGLLAMAIFVIRMAYLSFQGFRLYIWSQVCKKKDLVARYGKWAVISGATDGIGRALAFELARRGHSIVVIGRNELKLADTKADLEQVANAGEVVTIRIDLSDSSLQNFDRIKGQLDADKRDIGILINNAGIVSSPAAKYNDCDMDAIRQTVNTNVLATLHLTWMIMPGMLSRGKGLIVNVSSVLGDASSALTNVYGPSKAFINRFSHNLKYEYSNSGVDIVNLTPGPVRTKMILDNAELPGLLDRLKIAIEPDTFARIVVNALGTRIHRFSGTIWHGLMGMMYTCTELVGLGNWLRSFEYKMMKVADKAQRGLRIG